MRRVLRTALPGALLAATLALAAGGCATHADTLRLERDLAALKGQQEQILDQMAELEVTRARVTNLERAMGELSWQRQGLGVPDTREILNLLAAERQRSEQQLELVRDMLALIEERLGKVEARPAGRPPAAAARPRPEPAPPVAHATPRTEPAPAPAAARKPAPKPATAPPAPAVTRHTVAPGETLGTIATLYLGSPTRWREVWGANPAMTDPHHLKVGQRLNVPGTIAPAMPATAAPRAAVPSMGRHTVRAGETLGTLATAYLGAPDHWKAIWRANPALGDPNRLEVGQIIIIPVPETDTAPHPTAPAPSAPPTPGAAPVPPAPPTPTLTALAVPGTVDHVVVVGDTLGTLAARYLGDPALWEWIREANPHVDNPDRLEAGDVLLIPAPGAPRPQARPLPPPKPREAVTGRHVVAAGDTLGSIAERHLGSKRLWKRVWAANPWLTDPDRLTAGMALTLPAPPPDGGPPTRHTVAAGDTLGTIAARYFGDPAFWETVWRANPQLTNPDRLTAGQILTIPSAAPIPDSPPR
ncbi:MAG: LysM peptidoglycan-binding domain-containing protein [Nitrospirae bacterium]|nr:LysM peptidoglycan-binding domain-containing protein [Nitrospirota bacterium]